MPRLFSYFATCHFMALLAFCVPFIIKIFWIERDPQLLFQKSLSRFFFRLKRIILIN
uniref:Uncharacterized protein n=1 Tax=Lepeophtheirus salmonis TaxID=72036 RepID=A0A0K2U352_LEPSM